LSTHTGKKIIGKQYLCGLVEDKENIPFKPIFLLCNKMLNFFSKLIFFVLLVFAFSVLRRFGTASKFHIEREAEK
jgi:hypothetical protein